jgi:hypothetical protein
VVMPLAMIEKPRPGYVMELMEGLVPLERLMLEFDEEMRKGHELEGLRVSGGLERRLALLAKLARVLARLHGLGIAHGDLSPKNVFVSSSHEHAQVWLIDADNLTYAVRDSSLQIYTPDYGAPELIREELGISTYTDIWSFAVIAFQLLTHLHPLKSGLLVDGDAELEGSALKGALPWIDHPDDDRNRAETGFDRQLVCTEELQRLFDQCFRQGLNEPAGRPVMSEWAEAFEAALANLVRCDHSAECCQGAFYWNANLECPFCSAVAPEDHCILFEHRLLAAKSAMAEGSGPGDRWIETGWKHVLGSGTFDLKGFPPGSEGYADADSVASLTLSGDTLHVRPTGGVRVALRVEGGKSASALTGRVEITRRARGYTVHVGNVRATHHVWRFVW